MVLAMSPSLTASCTANGGGEARLTAFMEGIKWHTEDDAAVRRSVLLRILLVLKQKYGKVDARISNIARRAELALYTRAHTRDEYGNPRTLSKRLHVLIVKLYAHQSGVAAKLKRPTPVFPESTSRSNKRRCLPTNSDMLLDGHDGVIRLVTSFLDTPSLVALSSTTHRARNFIPQCVTTLRLAASNLPCMTPMSWMAQFPNVESVTLVGDNRFGFGEIAMEHIDIRSNTSVEWLLTAIQAALPLPRLEALALQHVFCDGLDDPFTSTVAALVPMLPSLRHLVLVGNCITDVGALHLATTAAASLSTLNLNNNFIGERGVAALRSVPASCHVTMADNLALSSC
ncbi:hypothetical protein H310_12605 [Aphanomyces invadans]|uniref:Uncharacterized protein n=1 Tax=Aphanomyces invadans TaxID=157072 RepID=A0A024TID0_9STRA|nr:hypothetical protein H310_12605 [Aphanomyces invadans]ETV93341.1 hypothetical protein H310_12605 [Aphanomyces invadans]|eukprot:XP_008877977.1 hypothetical protein H310_12605 [Aphanomyces invadans]